MESGCHTATALYSHASLPPLPSESRAVLVESTAPSDPPVTQDARWMPSRSQPLCVSFLVHNASSLSRSVSCREGCSQRLCLISQLRRYLLHSHVSRVCRYRWFVTLQGRPLRIPNLAYSLPCRTLTCAPNRPKPAGPAAGPAAGTQSSVVIELSGDRELSIARRTKAVTERLAR